MTTPAPSQDIEISYAAHTASCTFLLDDDGICRRIVMAPRSKRRESSRTAGKCVGAQYVASLDGSAAGGMVEMPRVGATMLFARIDDGRVSLVRTSVLISFETLARAGEDPFVDSASCETSAPVLKDLETPRAPRSVAPPAAVRPPPDPDDYGVASERTQRIPALRPEDYADILLGDDDRTNELGGELGEMATSEYATAPDAAPADTSYAYGPPSAPVRPTLPSPAPAESDVRLAPRVRLRRNG